VDCSDGSWLLVAAVVNLLHVADFVGGSEEGTGMPLVRAGPGWWW